MSSLKRHFTAVVGSNEHGLYISSSPSSAARKIVGKLCAASKSKKVEFCVRETTNGSKKKTYGPYLGEMKKLAKPIELKGRVIRFDIKVHLKKKKTAKKIGKKMRGGRIGEKAEDFYIKTTHNNNLTVNPIIQYSFLSREPHIFFGGPVSPTFTDRPPYIYYYQYVVYNSGYGNSKKAKFNQLIGAEFVNSFSVKENVLIRQIPEDALIKLRDFIFDQRKQDPTFCKTIYDAVVAVVGGKPQQNE
jgi:hypothetical protein